MGSDSIDPDVSRLPEGSTTQNFSLSGDGVVANSTANAPHIFGSAHDDTFTGDSGANVLYGGGGADALNGGGGNDRLIGGVGNDTLTGGEGNDILVGDSGSDVFKFTGTLAANNADTVKDFTVGAGEDVLNLHDVLAGTPAQNSSDSTVLGAHINVQTVGSNTVISVDADGVPGGAIQVVTLEGVTGVTLAQLLSNNQIIT